MTADSFRPGALDNTQATKLLAHHVGGAFCLREATAALGVAAP
jgi:hypothetical protein